MIHAQQFAIEKQLSTTVNCDRIFQSIPEAFRAFTTNLLPSVSLCEAMSTYIAIISLHIALNQID